MWHQETSGHTATTVRKQRDMIAGAQLSLSPFYSVSDPSPQDGAILPTIRMSLSPNKPLKKHPLSDV